MKNRSIKVNQRDASIFRNVVDGTSCAWMAGIYGISAGRVRQLVEHTMFKIRDHQSDLGQEQIPVAGIRKLRENRLQVLRGLDELIQFNLAESNNRKEPQ